MDRLEKVELIREKTGVTYDDAQAALAANGDDVLDAIVWLERLGKVDAATAQSTTQAPPYEGISPEMVAAQQSYERSSEKTNFGKWLDKTFEVLKNLCRKGLDTSFVVERRGERIISVPVLLLVIGLFAWWATIPVLIIGLFFDCHYHFEGIDRVSVDINEVMDAASEGATSIKESVKREE